MRQYFFQLRILVKFFFTLRSLPVSTLFVPPGLCFTKHNLSSQSLGAPSPPSAWALPISKHVIAAVKHY